MTPKEKRLEIVNEIIKDIASRGRCFFKYENNIAYMFLKNGKIYMRNEWNGHDMLIKEYDRPKHWHHGGTLLGLTKDFAEFIRVGGYTNGNNGYGGLYSPHWGYPEDDMKAIQIKAKELGYLNN